MTRRRAVSMLWSLTDNRGLPRQMLAPGAIRHPAVRAAALRFERETGRRLADELGDERDEGIIAIFLIVAGYPPDDPDPGGGEPARRAA